MGIYIPNIEKPKDCSECILANKHLNGLCEAKYYCRLEADSCPLIDIVTCGECKHKPIKHDPEGDEYGFNLVSPNGYDNLCPCLNTDDGFYSYMPDDNFFCAFGERRAE